MFYELVRSDIQKVEDYISTTLAHESKEVYEMILPYILRGGKRLRPMLAILCNRAVGGNSDDVIRAAGIIEMFHNFTLIHDDLMDDSQFRRGEPTLHVSHGMSIAINSGDALYTMVWRELVKLNLDPEKKVELQRIFVDTFKEVAEGQGTELAWENSNRFDINEDEYLSMIHGKTASLIGLSCAAGAMLGGADSKIGNRLTRFGEKIGSAFQIHDDVLNVTGTFEKYQKEIGGDITEGKRTLMVVHALKKCDEQTKDRIIKILGSHSRDKEDIDFVVAAFEKTGSIEYAKEKAIALIEDAESELKKLPESEEKQALVAICDYIISRES